MEIEYNYVHCSFFSETVKVTFTFKNPHEIQQLHLMLVSGECEVNCNGSQNICNVSEEERNMTNVSISEQGESM